MSGALIQENCTATLALRFGTAKSGGLIGSMARFPKWANEPAKFVIAPRAPNSSFRSCEARRCRGHGGIYFAAGRNRLSNKNRYLKRDGMVRLTAGFAVLDDQFSFVPHVRRIEQRREPETQGGAQWLMRAKQSHKCGARCAFLFAARFKIFVENLPLGFFASPGEKIPRKFFVASLCHGAASSLRRMGVTLSAALVTINSRCVAHWSSAVRFSLAYVDRL